MNALPYDSIVDQEILSKIDVIKFRERRIYDEFWTNMQEFEEKYFN